MRSGIVPGRVHRDSGGAGLPGRRAGWWGVVILLSCLASLPAAAQQAEGPPEPSRTPAAWPETQPGWNERSEELEGQRGASRVGVYRIGPHDLLEISVFEAPELNRSVRVTGGGEIHLPLLGPVRATGLSEEELARVLEELLRRRYMKDPHVGVFVREMESHPVAVFGAVENPGVYQIRGTRTLIEVLSLAGGLAEDAGDTVLVIRAGPGVVSGEEGNGEAESPADAGTVRIDLKELLESGEKWLNVPVHPGDVVKVTRAGIVYVVGDVHKPGGFLLRGNENISVLQAIALAEGLTATSAKGRTLIICTAADGRREEMPLDLGRILKGKDPDPLLEPNDILFVPNSTAKTAALRGLEAVVHTVTGLIIFSSR